MEFSSCISYQVLAIGLITSSDPEMRWYVLISNCCARLQNEKFIV